MYSLWPIYLLCITSMHIRDRLGSDLAVEAAQAESQNVHAEPYFNSAGSQKNV